MAAATIIPFQPQKFTQLRKSLWKKEKSYREKRTEKKLGLKT
jgi:hypothetical protein